MSQNLKRNLLIVIGLILLVLFGQYYLGSEHATEQAPPPQVEIKTIRPQKVRVWSEFSGRLVAVDAAEIKPEVNGRIMEVKFEDGDLVNEGDILFVIDPRPYEAAVEKAEAELATAKTNANFSKIEKERAEKMIKTQAIAQRIYDERFNANEVALASIQSAEAALLQAKIDLDRAYLKAPISGRAGRVEVTVGNIVQSGPNAPLLTRIVTYDPIYADFEVDEQTYVQNVRNVANNRSSEQKIPVELFLSGDKEHVYKGSIYSFDNRLDTSSGTIRARAKFSNPNGVLVPGMFVSVRFSGDGEKEVLLVPQQAIGSDQSKKFVYVVNENNKVVYQPVEVGKEVKSDRIITEGLKTGDRVIIKGIQHIKPDQLVEVKENGS